MKAVYSVLVAVAVLFLFNSCKKVTGEGPMVNQTRSVGTFSGLSISISGNVQYRQDSVHKVEIQAQQNILDVIETRVMNNELVIKFKNSVKVKDHEPINVFISSPSMTSLGLSGSGSLSALGSFNSQHLRLRLSGSGNLTVQNIVTGNIDAAISGSGNIKVLSGSAASETLEISGSGDMDFKEVAVATANTKTSGSGNMYVNVSQRLDAKISGSGSVMYRGTPVVSASISGSGQVRPL